jgi:hypothetical protein
VGLESATPLVGFAIVPVGLSQQFFRHFQSRKHLRRKNRTLDIPSWFRQPTSFYQTCSDKEKGRFAQCKSTFFHVQQETGKLVLVAATSLKQDTKTQQHGYHQTMAV